MWSFPKFSKLTEFSTSRNALFLFNLFPPVHVILTLLGIAVLVAVGNWLWLGAIGFSSAFLGQSFYTALSIVGLAVINTFFRREIMGVVLKARIINPGILNKEDPLDLCAMVDTCCEIVNKYFQNVPGHQDIERPRLYSIPGEEFKIVTVEGSDPSSSALFFSDKAINLKTNGLNQLELASLIIAELTKIYLRRGVTDHVSNALIDLGASLSAMSDLQNSKDGSFLSNVFSAIGCLSWPLQLTLSLQMSLKRSFVYEAAKHVCKIGLGIPYLKANNQRTTPSLYKSVTPLQASRQKEQRLAARKENAPHSQYRWLAAIQAWIDEHEPPTDGFLKRSRLRSMFEIFIREPGFYWQEVTSATPRNTNLGTFLKTKLGITQANRARMKAVKKMGLNEYRKHFLQIKTEKKYGPIMPLDQTEWFDKEKLDKGYRAGYGKLKWVRDTNINDDVLTVVMGKKPPKKIKPSGRGA